MANIHSNLAYVGDCIKTFWNTETSDCNPTYGIISSQMQQLSWMTIPLTFFHSNSAIFQFGKSFPPRSFDNYRTPIVIAPRSLPLNHDFGSFGMQVCFFRLVQYGARHLITNCQRFLLCKKSV